MFAHTHTYMAELHHTFRYMHHLVKPANKEYGKRTVGGERNNSLRTYDELFI
jgi:hypothetical protein